MSILLLQGVRRAAQGKEWCLVKRRCIHRFYHQRSPQGPEEYSSIWLPMTESFTDKENVTFYVSSTHPNSQFCLTPSLRSCQDSCPNKLTPNLRPLSQQNLISHAHVLGPPPHNPGSRVMKVMPSCSCTTWSISKGTKEEGMGKVPWVEVMYHFCSHSCLPELTHRAPADYKGDQHEGEHIDTGWAWIVLTQKPLPLLAVAQFFYLSIQGLPQGDQSESIQQISWASTYVKRIHSFQCLNLRPCILPHEIPSLSVYSNPIPSQNLDQILPLPWSYTRLPTFQ